jgi:Zn-dependent alcohol dehydrogenase
VRPGVTKLRPGDHVVVAAVPHCGQCRSWVMFPIC